MVASTWCHRALWGNLLCGVNVDRLEFWIDTFELVIHLSKGQQMALPFCTFCEVPLLLLSLVKPFKCISSVRCWAEHQKPLILQHFHSDTASCHDMRYRQAHDFQVWSFSLLVVWWGNTFCASNSLELVQLFMPLRHDLTTVPVQGIIARILGSRNWVLLVNYLFWFLIVIN